MITITIRKGNTRDGDGNTYSCQIQNIIIDFCFVCFAYAVVCCDVWKLYDNPIPVDLIALYTLLLLMAHSSFSDLSSI